jgi:hypothetical protein
MAVRLSPLILNKFTLEMSEAKVNPNNYTKCNVDLPNGFPFELSRSFDHFLTVIKRSKTLKEEQKNGLAASSEVSTKSHFDISALGNRKELKER